MFLNHKIDRFSHHKRYIQGLHRCLTQSQHKQDRKKSRNSTRHSVATYVQNLIYRSFYIVLCEIIILIILILNVNGVALVVVPFVVDLIVVDFVV